MNIAEVFTLTIGDETDSGKRLRMRLHAAQIYDSATEDGAQLFSFGGGKQVPAGCTHRGGTAFGPPMVVPRRDGHLCRAPRLLPALTKYRGSWTQSAAKWKTPEVDLHVATISKLC